MLKFKEKIELLPAQSGVYLMKDKDGHIIYVGKANILRQRVRSYFSGSHDAKTQRLVQDIHDFETIITASNIDALLLECNLIKKHNPRYNVLLKDDKTYPYIKLTREKHPRLEITRQIKKDKAKYFGPYPNAGAASETKKLLDRLYPLRKCNHLPDRVCLYYHMGQCLAPCEYEVEQQEYDQIKQQITQFLNGGHKPVLQELNRKMLQASEMLDFERAKELRDLMQQIEQVMQKQSITIHDWTDRDVFGYAFDKGWICVQVFFVRQGKLLERDVSVFPFYVEDIADALLTFIGQFYMDKEHVLPTEILIPNLLDADMLAKWLQVKVHTPQRGLKKELFDMACANARKSLQEKFELIDRNEERTIRAVEKLGQALGVGAVKRIEAFDNSNTQGSHAVSAMVVFVDGKPIKNDYRKFKIKTVQGPDDYASMREVIRRRYTRLLKERKPLPDLIIIDGGKGQMSVAQDVLENELGLYIPVCGLVKDDKHRSSQLLMGDPAQLIDLERDSQAFYLLQRIQDEVHRFAVTFHRQIRSKSMIQSALDQIPGVGPKRKKQLLKHFGTLKKIKEADVEQFSMIGIGPKTAQTILEHLNK